MKYILTVLMVIPTYYSISFANNLEFNSNSILSGSISSSLVNALEDEGCSDGSITLEIDNPNNPFYIEWSNGETSESIGNLIPGEYCVTVTDDMCGEAIGCWEIKCCPFLLEDDQIYYNISNPACEGQTGKLELFLSSIDADEFPLGLFLENASDDTKYDLTVTSSNASFIKLTEGNYTGQINYGEGCSNSFEFEIIFQPIEIQFEKTGSCDNDGTITVNASFGKLPYTYAWSDDESQTGSYRSGLSTGFYKVTVSDANTCSAASSAYIKNGDPIITENVTVFIGPSDCFINTGVIDITTEPEGGSPPFFYEWSNGDNGKLLENVAGGDYQLIISDELGCSATLEYTIPVDGQPVVNSAVVTKTCAGQNNGEIGILASSTTGGDLTYSWSNGSTNFVLENLYADTYTVTITDQSNSCSLIKSYNVEEFSGEPIVVSGTVKNNCESEGDNNGEISLNISGGIKPYSFLWNTGETSSTISNLSEGEYTATITDKCGNVEYFTHNITSVQINVNIDVIYPNFEEVILEAKVNGGTSPYDYIWNTGSELPFLVEEEEGTYSVTVTDQNGCTKSESVEVICEPSDFNFITTSSCASSFKLKIGSNSGIGPGPFLVKVEKKINLVYETVDFRQFETQQELLNYEFVDADLGSFRVTVTNYCGYPKTELFNSCIDCDYYFFNDEEQYFASAMGDLLFFELVCPCSNDCGFLGLTTDKVKLILNQPALNEFSNSIGGFPTFKIIWPSGISDIYFNANINKFEINGPSEYTLTDEEYENGITISVSISLPFGVGEVCNLDIPFEFGKEGYNGYFSKWDNIGLNPFYNYDPPYNWATIACPNKCTIPVIDGVLYENEPIDSDDERDNYANKCEIDSDVSVEFFFYQPNDYTNPCDGGGYLLTHYESVVGVISGQLPIAPNVAIDAHPYWTLDMLEEKNPLFPYKCPPHTFEKGYCLFDSRDVYGEDVILRDPIIASYCKGRTYDPPIDTDEDGLPDVVDPCPLNPDLFCLDNDGNAGDGGSGPGGGGGGGGGGSDENGCQTTFLPNECRLAIVCPNEDVVNIYGTIQTESYKGATPCIHCFTVDVCRVTDPNTGTEYSEVVGPITGSVGVTTVDDQTCGTICAILFTCAATGEEIITLCNPGCTTYDYPICDNNTLYNVIPLLQEEGAPESIELEMTPEFLLQLINDNRNIETDNKTVEKLITIPNPSKKDFIVQFESQQDNITNIQIHNTYNQSVLTKQVAAKKGTNKFKIDNDLPTGLYIISIKINGNTVSTKHVIHN